MSFGFDLEYTLHFVLEQVVPNDLAFDYQVVSRLDFQFDDFRVVGAGLNLNRRTTYRNSEPAHILFLLILLLLLILLHVVV